MKNENPTEPPIANPAAHASAVASFNPEIMADLPKHYTEMPFEEGEAIMDTVQLFIDPKE